MTDAAPPTEPGPNRCPRAMVHAYPCQCDCCVGWCKHPRIPEPDAAPRTPADRTKPPPGWQVWTARDGSSDPLVVERDRSCSVVPLARAWAIYDREHGALHQGASEDVLARIREALYMVDDLGSGDELFRVTRAGEYISELRRERDALADRTHASETFVDGLAKASELAGESALWFDERGLTHIANAFWAFAEKLAQRSALSPTAAPIPEEP